MLVTELRCVLPSSLGDSLLSGEDARSAWFPSLRGVNLWPPGARRCAGCWRLRIEAGRVQGQGARRATRYRCWLPLCPVHLLVSLNAAVFQGDCLEENALQLAPAWLRRRTVERWEVESEERSGPSVTTVYYCLSIQLEASGPLGLLLRPLLPVLSFRFCGSAAHQVAMKWLKRHWQVRLQHHARPAVQAATPGAVSGLPLCSPKPCEEPPTPQGRDPSAANGLSISTEGAEMDSAQNSPMEAEVLPSSKGMPFHNGFLYKLGDGILNTTWNLRYFLLIGQTLQYYRSQHEARPKDAINLSGVTVEWLRDQSRPFSFTVKSASRSYCLSGCTEQEASEWMERIQAASKINNTSVTTPSSRRQNHPSPSDLPELALPAASTWQEAKMKECSQVLTQALQQRQFRLRELRHGVRILEPDPPEKKLRWKVEWALAIYVSTAVLYLYGVVGWVWVCVALGVFLTFGVFGGEPPLLVAAACLKHSAEEIKEALGEHWRFQEWQPQHLHAQALSLLPGRDEVLRLRFRVLGGVRNIELRRRWARSEGNARLLLCVEELQQGDVREFEGFAIQPLEEGCAVLWLCCFDLLPWAPRIVREELVVRRISALAALREWLPWSRRTGPKMSMGRMEQRLNTSFSRSGAMLKDSLQLQAATIENTRGYSQVLPLLLRPFQRSGRQVGAVLEAPNDTERATIWVDLLMEIGRQALRGGKEVFVVSKPHGILPQTLLGDFTQRLAARWASVATLCPLCPGQGGGPESKERMLRVITFMVSGLHLATAAFPHLPWLDFACAPGRHTTVLPEDCTAQIDVQDGSGTLRRSSFEVTSAGHFRLHGNDEVRCRLRFPGGFSFQDTGSTTVEFDPGRRTEGRRVRFGMPCLEVRPSRHSLGSGSIFYWTGSSSFADESGMQCRLHFGERQGEEDVHGVLRDADGSQVARLHGSWLGPLLCDGEVLWKGPAM